MNQCLIRLFVFRTIFKLEAIKYEYFVWIISTQNISRKPWDFMFQLFMRSSTSVIENVGTLRLGTMTYAHNDTKDWQSWLASWKARFLVKSHSYSQACQIGRDFEIECIVKFNVGNVGYDFNFVFIVFWEITGKSVSWEQGMSVLR